MSDLLHETICAECGAVIGFPEVHAAWHRGPADEGLVSLADAAEFLRSLDVDALEAKALAGGGLGGVKTSHRVLELAIEALESA